MTPEAKTIFPPNADKSIWDVMQDCALSSSDEESLKQYAESLGLIYLSTPFSRAAANFCTTLAWWVLRLAWRMQPRALGSTHRASMGKPRS